MIHPDYNEKWQHPDIAILELNTKFELTDLQRCNIVNQQFQTEYHNDHHDYYQ